MECEKTQTLRRLAVYEPDVLNAEPWRSHVNECPNCFFEWRALATSLAVYRHVEREDAARHPLKPSWEAYQRRLQQQRTERRRASMMTSTWMAGMVGLVLFGGAMSWGLWSDSGSSSKMALVLDEEDLSINLADQSRIARRNAVTPRETPVIAPAGSYGLMSAELRRWRLLEPHTMATGRPSGEIAIIPFSHENRATPYVMPVTSAPGSGIHLSYANNPSFQGGYVLTSPVH